MVNLRSPLSPAFVPSLWRDFVADVRALEGVRDPIELHVNGTPETGATLYLLDGVETPTAAIRGRFRYHLNPLLANRLDQAGATFYRPLLESNFRAISDDILYLDLVQTPTDLHGRGIGGAYYRHLKSFALNSGDRVLAHHHIGREATRFFLRQGCMPLDAIKPEFRFHFGAVEQEDPGVTGWAPVCTLSFLDPADAARYVYGL